MINAPHIVETALLLLAAFLVGAVIGFVARVIAARVGKKPAVAVAAVAAPVVAATGPQLVTAPEIAPLPASLKPSAAERIAAAAGKPVEAAADTPAVPVVEEPPLMPAVKIPAMAALPDFVAAASFQPARVAGETLSGKHIENPEHGAQPAAAVPPPAVAPVPVAEAAPIAQPVLAPKPAPFIEPAAAAAAVEPAPEKIIEPAPAMVVEPPQPAPAPVIEPIPAIVVEPPQPVPAPVVEAIAEAEPATPEPMPEAASLADVRAELEAQIESELLAQPDEPQPVETRIEPEIAPEPQVEILDTPKEVAAEIQDVIELAADEPIPEVVPEAPLVESSFDQHVEPIAAAPADAVPVAEEMLPSPAADMGEPGVDDETAAMRAIEGGWSPRRTPTRSPAPRPEGVPADVVAADAAVAASSAAVASATAAANAALDGIEPTPVRKAGKGD